MLGGLHIMGDIKTLTHNIPYRIILMVGLTPHVIDSVDWSMTLGTLYLELERETSFIRRLLKGDPLKFNHGTTMPYPHGRVFSHTHAFSCICIHAHTFSYHKAKTHTSPPFSNLIYTI